jgi:large subunit ribosomal protein L18
MDHSQKRKRRARFARVKRVRKKISGTVDCPRLSVYKSNRHLYVQLIDDESRATIAGIGTLSKNSSQTIKKSKKNAKVLGTEIANLAKEKNIHRVIFDRGRNKFHGLIAELANSARESGLQF